LLFWKKTSEKGIAASIVVGIVSSLAIILTSPTMWDRYGLDPLNAVHQLENPALISFPLAVGTVLDRKSTRLNSSHVSISYAVFLTYTSVVSLHDALPIFLLFWKKTSEKGIAASIVVGIVSSLAIILTSPTMWDRYGLDPLNAVHQLENPALISFPLAVGTV